MGWWEPILASQLAPPAPETTSISTSSIHKERPVADQTPASLYARLGGYDAIAAVADDLLPRLMSDPQLGRFWAHRGEDGIRREKQLLIDFLCACAGGPLYYTGRDMATSHKGMGISARDWEIFLGHVHTTLDKFQVSQRERREVLAFVESTRADIVEQ
jgi:hemoglobin